MSGPRAAEFDRRIEDASDETIWREYYAPVSPARRRRQTLLQRAIAPAAGERLLDVGCGAGGLALWAARQGARVLGVDYSGASLRAATRLGRRPGGAHPAYVQADATALPVATGRFDTVVAVDLLDMLAPDRHEATLVECLRALRGGGRLLLYTPNGRREAIGAALRPLRRRLGAWQAPECRLHVGLTTPGRLRRLLRRLGVEARLVYCDMNYPWLAALPGLRAGLAGHMLWVVRRGPSG